jgi:Cof subfamily protein (haloacid dehalogenase superfamily)
VTAPAAAPASPRRPRPRRIRLLLSDVDGTLVTDEKVLTETSVRAARALGAAGIRLAITSSRPPAGLRMLLEPLGIDAPIGAFNGGMIVAPEAHLRVLEQHLLPPAAGAATIEFLADRGVDVWVFTAERWAVRDPKGAYVDHEVRTIGFAPTVVPGFSALLGGVGKIVGVSRDFDLLERGEAELRQVLGEGASVARSQRYYLDVTHPLANKGTVVLALARRLGIPAGEIVTVGDGFNDLAMFARAGWSIAMGNAAPQVQAAADVVTAPNGEDGFAAAVERHVLGRSGP